MDKHCSALLLLVWNVLCKQHGAHSYTRLRAGMVGGLNPIPTPPSTYANVSLEMYPSKSLLAEELLEGMFLR